MKAAFEMLMHAYTQNYIASFVENHPDADQALVDWHRERVSQTFDKSTYQNHQLIAITQIMHDHMQAQIDELVEALGDAFADPDSLINSEATMNRVAELLAKHRRAGDD